jgi:hypothetical protein
MTGNDVKRLIRGVNLSQADFAGMTGWHPVSISRLVGYRERRIPAASARRIKASLALVKRGGKARQGATSPQEETTGD